MNKTIFINLQTGGLSLKLLEFRIDEYVFAGARPSLMCRWELQTNEKLYSVKWYKDGKEFFRYIPKDREPKRKFSLPGVDVQESDSFGSNIVLSAAELATSGRYRCEVSGEKPHFHTVSNHKDMVVIVPPEAGPTITGFIPSYKEGDVLDLNCSSGPSHPKPTLTWYINGELIPVENKHKLNYSSDVSTISLNYEISETNFMNRLLKVKCLATIPPYYWRSIEKVAIIGDSRRNILKANNAHSRSKANASFILTSKMYILLSIFLSRT